MLQRLAETDSPHADPKGYYHTKRFILAANFVSGRPWLKNEPLLNALITRAAMRSGGF